jgi:hypothetical protein
MTIAPDHHEPFDAEPFSDEERELAARLGRIGPVDGPSPALDARILAAAHAASVPRRPAGRRRFAWFGVPPALVTGVGVAAAAVLALGVVWQLRPQYGLVTAQGEADAGEEIILIAPPSDPAAPQGADALAVPERMAPTEPATRTRPQASPPAAPRAASVPETASQAAASVAAPAPEAPATHEAGSISPSAAPEVFKREADESANPRRVDDDFVATPPDSAHRNATYTTAARAAAERRERSAAQKASAATATASEEEGTTLDRIEVTGSRIRAEQDVDWSQVPVNDDTHLPSIEWLERIRARRDAGDVDSARASLERFQREYPRIRLPEDLRALLADTKQ